MEPARRAGENQVFEHLVLVGLGLVATPAIVTFLIRNRTSDAAFPFFFTVGTASLVSASSSDLRSADFSPTGLVHRVVRRRGHA